MFKYNLKYFLPTQQRLMQCYAAWLAVLKRLLRNGFSVAVLTICVCLFVRWAQTYAEIALVCAVKNAAFPLHRISSRPSSVEKLTFLTLHLAQMNRKTTPKLLLVYIFKVKYKISASKTAAAACIEKIKWWISGCCFCLAVLPKMKRKGRSTAWPHGLRSLDPHRKYANVKHKNVWELFRAHC